MWVHMAFVSSILLGKDAMWTVTKFFEGYFFFGRSYPWIVSIAVATVIALVVLHALLAVRKFPIEKTSTSSSAMTPACSVACRCSPVTTHVRNRFRSRRRLPSCDARWWGRPGNSRVRPEANRSLRQLVYTEES
jgi:hypothetical protein